MRTTMFAGTACLMTFASAASDLERGREAAARCIACHGPTGISPNPTFPHLAGQNAAYVASQLEHFRDGTRYHAVMTPIAESLTGAEIDDLATYYASLSSVVAATASR
jgi:cytochrome c553